MFCLFLDRNAFTSMQGKNIRILHFGPEPHIHFTTKKEKESTRVIAADIHAEGMTCADGTRVQTDVQRIAFDSESFDAIVCIHLLEHVENDILALHELFRVLKPGGAAYIMVPFAPIPASRELGRPDPLLFGHVREYSQQDFEQRLHEFYVNAIAPLSIMTPEEQRLFQIPDHQVIFICQKAVPDWPSSGK